MKGTILVCLREAIVAKYSRAKWEEVLAGANLPPYTIIGPSSNVEDSQADTIIGSAIKLLGAENTVEIFCDYWTNVHAQKLYRRFYEKHDNARAFLLTISDLHANMTKWIPDAKPPAFLVKDLPAGDLEITYESHRNYEIIAEGLVRSTCKFYNETATVVRFGNIIRVRGLRKA